MAFCDFLLTQDIQGYDCENPPQKGAQAMGWLYNRADLEIIGKYNHHCINFVLKDGATAYRVYQSGKRPWNGTQQEMVEGENTNTITNTLQVVVLKQDKNWAQQLFALLNGEFVACIKVNGKATDFYANHNWLAFGGEAGLHCTGAVRELYNDDTLAGWQLTFVEEGASRIWYCQDPASIPVSP